MLVCLLVCFVAGRLSVFTFAEPLIHKSESQDVADKGHTHHFVQYLDVNKDNILERREYVDLVIQRAKSYVNTARQSELDDVMQEAWLDFLSNDKNDYAESVNMELWNREGHRTPRRQRQHRIFIRAIFHIFDTNNNERWDEQELANFFDVFQVPTADLGLSFDKIDVNQNGGIDKNEFLDLAYDASFLGCTPFFTD